MSEPAVVLADPAGVEWAAELQRATGVSVEAVTDAEEAISLLSPSTECLVTATTLDGERDGVELASTSREQSPAVPVVLFGPAEPDDCGPVNAVVSAPTLAARRALVTMQVERRADLRERYTDRADPLCILDDERRFSYVNEAFASEFGYEQVELEGAYWDAVADEDRDTAELLQRVTEEGEWHGPMAATRRDGTAVTANSSLRRTADGGVVATVREISRRPAEANALQALGEIAESLATVDSETEVCRIVADTVATLDGGPSIVLYLFDEDARSLEPVAAGGQLVADPPSFEIDGENPVTEAFFTDEADLTETTLGRLFTDEADAGHAQALGNAGVCVSASDARSGDAALDLVSPFARTASAAFDRIQAQTKLDDRDGDVRSLSNRVDQLTNVTKVLRAVDESLVRSRTREAVDRNVCEALVSFAGIEFAWVGERDGDGVDVRTWVGAEDGYLDAIDFHGDEPTVNTVQTGEPTLVTDVGTDLHANPWRRGALSRGFDAVMSVPLKHRDIEYGAVTVYASSSETFDDVVQSVLVELGAKVGHALNAVETRLALLSDRVAELELSFTEPDTALFRLAETSDTPLVFDEFVPRENDDLFVYCIVPNDGVDTVVTTAKSLVGIDDVSVIADDADDESLLELQVSGLTVAVVAGDFGARVRRASADGSTLTLRVELPRELQVREFVGYLQRHFSTPELLARRDIDQPTRTRREFRAALEEALTEKQLETLRTAHTSGYFEWPRESTGEEIAESLGVTQPTVNRHLRASERKLFEMLFKR
ncbi:bacterio-opsin activator domain-containing protein [Haloarchaeobius sp. DFWS5]|uniref:bacterio-opsin activator domain-containing protein n=1 Tax=Haloarchaeobius sp. DFWS5 TaxID=3446114 RepID=UPI003EBDC354